MAGVVGSLRRTGAKILSGVVAMMMWLIVGSMIIMLLGLLVAAVAGLPSLLHPLCGGLGGACPPPM